MLTNYPPKLSYYLALCTVLFATLISPIHLLAQIGGSGSIQGTITDPSAATVPGGTVTAQNTATGVKTTRQTTGAGVYVLSPLQPGEYTVTSSGFGRITAQANAPRIFQLVGRITF